MVTLTRLRRFIHQEAQATGLPLGTLVVVAVTIHLVVAVLAVNPWHPDEHFQILEFAWARSGLSPLQALPWEFAARIRPALQPTLAMGLLGALRGIGASSPYPWMLLLRLGTLAVAFGVILWVFAHVSAQLSRRGRQVLWLSGLFLWFAPLFLFRFTSENLGGLALVAALPFLDRNDEAGRRDWAAGGLLGLSFVLRFQMAFSIAALLLWVLVSRPRGLGSAIRMASAAAVVVTASTLVDAWFYGEWVFTPWLYFQSNVLEGVASSFGTQPWYAYLMWAPLFMAPPLGLVVAALVIVGVAAHPRSPWSWAFVAFLAGHSLVPHKELRFLFPLLYFLPVVTARGFELLETGVPLGRWRRVAVAALVAQNFILLALLATPSIHRGREFDAHYFRWLWGVAEGQKGDTVYVLQDEGSRIYRLDANVYRHPRVVGIDHKPGEPVPSDVPAGTPPERLLVLTRGSEVPAVRGAIATELAYTAEAGYRVMFRWIGMEDARLVGWLESLEGWSSLDRIRSVYRVHMSKAPAQDPS